MPPRAQGVEQRRQRPSQFGVHAADFRPHPLLHNAHLQTIVPSLLRPTPRLALSVETWELADGDFVRLGWFARPQRADQPLAVLVHGLTGGFESKYLRGTARRLIAAGWAGLILELRGAGPEPNRLPRNYHHGDTEDLHALLGRLRDSYPAATIANLGWSMGGNLCLKAAAESGAQHPADVVGAASVPFQLEPCAERLRTGFSRLYQHKLMRGLKAFVARKAQVVDLPGGVDLDAALNAPDFFVFDDAWTAPLHDFDDARDYYHSTACGQFLHRIRKPTLIVHAQDDPFMLPELLPSAECLSDSVRLEVSPRGGHVGFLSAGRAGQPQCWLERRMTHWLCLHAQPARN